MYKNINELTGILVISIYINFIKIERNTIKNENKCFLRYSLL